MPEFQSWESYLNFARKTKYECRFGLDKSVQEFLKTVLATSKSRYQQFSKGRYLWRAQRGNDLMQIHQKNEHVCDDAIPLSQERMKPIPNMAKEGRANPKGISYLYGATDKDTAMAEVRPSWLGSKISVGQFKIIKDITLVNCSEGHGKNLFCFGEPTAEIKEEVVWSHIGRAFSNPVIPNDRVADYIPTQIIAKLFKNNGLDGIAYKSNLGKGHNIVLFDLNIADIVNCFLYETGKIDCSFKETGRPYFFKKKKNKQNT